MHLDGCFLTAVTIPAQSDCSYVNIVGTNVEKEGDGAATTVEGEGAVALGRVLEMLRHSHVVATLLTIKQVDKGTLLSVATLPEQSLVALYDFMLTMCCSCRHVKEMEYVSPDSPTKENGRVQETNMSLNIFDFFEIVLLQENLPRLV